MAQVSYEFSLRHSIVEVDRDAERRWSMMIEKKRAAEAKGEEFSDSANIEERRLATGRKGPRLIKIQYLFDLIRAVSEYKIIWNCTFVPIMFEMFFCAVVGVWVNSFFRSQEYYLWANDGENHTNNVKMLEEINKQDWTTTRCFCRFWGACFTPWLTAQRNETFLTANQGDDKIKKAMEGFKIPAAGEDCPSGKSEVFATQNVQTKLTLQNNKT